MQHITHYTYNRIKKVVTLGLLTSLILTSMPSVVLADEPSKSTSQKIKEAEQLKEMTEKAKAATEGQVKTLEEQKSELESYLKKLNNDLEQISNDLSNLETQIESKQGEIEEAKQLVEEAKEEEANQYTMMKKRIKFMYERGDSTMIENFMNSRSYSEFLNKVEYISKVEDYDQQMYQNLVELRKEIEKREKVLEDEEAQLQIMLDQAHVEANKVSTMVTTTSGSLAETDGAISAAELESAAYEAELKIQEENLAALKKQLAEEQAMSAKASKMAWRDISEITFEAGDRDLLACLIYCEAGNQPYTGQVAVGAVVINRIRSAAYPNTMSGVIYQKGQFSPVSSGRLATRLSLGANAQCYQAADEAMSGGTPVGNCLYFRTVIPEINGMVIGNHVFY